MSVCSMLISSAPTTGDGTLSNQSKDGVLNKEKGVGRKRRVPGSKVQPEASTSLANGDYAGNSQLHVRISLLSSKYHINKNIDSSICVKAISHFY